MEWSAYLTITLRARLPTPVRLATLSMETPPGLVGVMECGVVVNQHVPVSFNNIPYGWKISSGNFRAIQDVVLFRKFRE